VTLALIGLALLAIVVFGFVLEPVLRARSDQAVLDAAVLPEHDHAVDDEIDEAEPAVDAGLDDRPAARHVTIDQPVSSDLS